MKIILNKCYGGFGLSTYATILYAKKKGIDVYPYKLDYRDKTYNTYIRATIDDISDCFLIKDYGDKVNSKNINWKDSYSPERDIIREDMDLINIVETLGDAANGRFAHLVVVDIPDELKDNYEIDDYDGIETLHMKVQYW